MYDALLTTDIREYPLLRRGKVRDVYDLDGTLLFVATDRISAYDWVMPNGIPGKGKILNSMSLFWFGFTNDTHPNHLVSGDFRKFPVALKKYKYLDGRSMIVKKAKRINIECVARGYLVGSGYRDFKELVERSGSEKKVNLYGYDLPVSIRLAGRLPETIFTPATKAEEGHDQNISFSDMAKIVGAKLANDLRKATISIYEKASKYALPKGIIIADTKFEFGFIDDELTLIDEILSPDSSRFWPADTYKEGSNPPSFDKQYIRDWLDGTGWDKDSEPPALPEEVVEKTLEKYRQAHKIIVGKDID